MWICPNLILIVAGVKICTFAENQSCYFSQIFNFLIVLAGKLKFGLILGQKIKNINLIVLLQIWLRLHPVSRF